MQKTIYTVNIDNFAPEITAITLPHIRRWAERCNADFHIIKDRKFPEFPAACEKLQIYDLSRERGDDWMIFIDADALVHPETPDFTEFLPRDTVMHHATDKASIRFRSDDYFRRDGRDLGSCNWLTFASSWCRELWHPLIDLTVEQATANIFPTVDERDSGVVDARHLLDDYILSRNIARFGLKVTTVPDLCNAVSYDVGRFFFHVYCLTPAKKYEMIRRASGVGTACNKSRGGGAMETPRPFVSKLNLNA